MGEQIIKQPDGKLAVFSTVVDDWIMANVTPEEIVEHYARRAYEAARVATLRTVGLVLQGKPREAYYQFALTYKQASQASERTRRARCD